MHVYGDMASISEACELEEGTELGELISRRIQELSPYVVDDLSELVKLIVVGVGDKLSDIDATLGFALTTRACDVAQSHCDWFELTLVLDDSGFGVVIYVPKHLNDGAELLAYCATQVASSAS